MNIMVEALLNTIMGMGTVFAVLIFMSLIISVFKYIPGFVEGFGKKDKTVEQKAAPERPVIVEEEEEEELVDDGELVAVITAAIMASYGGASSADKLVVRSIKRAKRTRR